MGRARSPNYPAISLADAVSKTRQLYNAEHRNRMSREAIAGVLGYDGLTGASVPVISALSKYGLIDGRSEQIQVSDDAVSILVDKKDAPERAAALERAASKPKIFAELDKQFPSTPTEETARIFLEKRGFTPNAARKAAKNYRESREYVHSESAELSDGSADESATEIQVGDLIQWESQGVMQFPKARRVVGVSEDGDFVFVEGSDTGVPIEQAVLEEQDSRKPPADAGQEGRGRNKPSVREEVFTLAEGNVIFQWPSSLSEESYQDLEDWISIILRKAKRATRAKTNPGVDNGESTK